MKPLAVDALSFDVAGVLVLPNPALVIADPAPNERWDAVHYLVRIRQEEATALVDWSVVAAAVGTTIARVRRYVDRLHTMHASPEVWQSAPDAGPFLAALRAEGVPVAAVSNTLRPMAFEVLNRARLIGPNGIEKDAIFDSAVIGIAKPDPRLFGLVFDRLGVPANRVVHVGDSLEDDVRGAQTSGAHAAHLAPFGGCDGPIHQDVRSLAELRSLLDFSAPNTATVARLHRTEEL